MIKNKNEINKSQLKMALKEKISQWCLVDGKKRVNHSEGKKKLEYFCGFLIKVINSFFLKPNQNTEFQIHISHPSKDNQDNCLHELSINQI